MPKLKLFQKKALTLIEMLIVVSLVALTALAIYRSLSTGIEIWKRNSQYIAEEDVVIFFEKISHDLNNAFLFSTINVSGRAHSFAFPTIVHTLDPSSGESEDSEYVDQIGRVSYFFDPVQKKLFRKIANYGQALSGRFGREFVLASHLNNVTFHYYFLGEDGEVFMDKLSGELPLGVEIEVEMDDGKGGSRVISKFINIPIVN